MLQKLKAFCLQHREKLLYLIFGGLTTVVDFSISFVLYYLWGDAIEATPWLVHGVDSIAWVSAVAFAYVTNRIWVFESRRTGLFPIIGEILAFAGGRVFTFLLQEGVMLLFVTWLGLNKFAIRIAAAVLVIIVNYIISKLIVFRKRG